MSNTPKLNTELTDYDGIPIVKASGEIDLYTVQQFESAVKDGIRRGSGPLIIDLRNISYLDSSGLSALLVAYKSLSARNADLYVLVSPDHPGICHVLEVTRLNNFIKTKYTIEEILEDIKMKRAA